MRRGKKNSFKRDVTVAVAVALQGLNYAFACTFWACLDRERPGPVAARERSV